jgi:hypothetical protein
MNLNNNYIFSILNKIKWNYHLVFTYPYSHQRYNRDEAIKLRSNIFFCFFSRLSAFFKMRRNKQIYAFSDDVSLNDQGHLHALYKLPEKYKGNNQEFVSTANRVWTASLGIPLTLANTINKPFISPICAESYHNKVNYVAEKIFETDSPDFLSHEASRIIQRCNSVCDSEYSADISRRQS